MPKPTPAYAAMKPKGPMVPITIERRDPGPRDVEIDILFASICHSDLHKVFDEWEGTTYPVVPGHEIVGRVAARGGKVKRFGKGDLVGVGCVVNSCRTCSECRAGREMFCKVGAMWTYDSLEADGKSRTYGGYSTRIVVDEHFVLKVPKRLDPAKAAPLLCAGITTYSPLKHWGCKRGSKVAVLGLGGLGHMGVRLAVSMGAEVTVMSSTRAKAKDARRLGAKHFVATTGPRALEGLESRFDIILDSVSAPHDVGAYLELLKPLGTMVLLGLPPNAVQATPVSAGSLIPGNRRLAGSNIGGIAETQEMLDHCGKKGIVADIEVIRANQIDEAYARMLKSDVRYRFVIDCKTMQG